MTSKQCQQLWAKARLDLRRELGANSYDAFLTNVYLKSVWEGRATICVGTTFLHRHVQGNYASAIKRVLQKHAPEVHTLDIVVESLPAKAKAADKSKGDGKSPPSKQKPTRQSVTASGATAGLEKRLRFENFVKGDTNRFAYETALKMVQGVPLAHGERDFLYIYGDVGNGKSHLLNAVGWGLLESGYRRVECVNAENFVNGFVESLRNKENEKFKEKFCSLDALLFDDFEFLLKKERSLQEWNFIFNELMRSGRKVVVTASENPYNLRGLPKHVRSRLGGALLAKISKSDYQMRLTLLHHWRAQNARSKAIPDEVLEVMAHRIKDSNRTLESAMSFLVAKNMLDKKPFTVAMAVEELSNFWQQERRNIKADDIMKAVAHYHGISVQELVSASRLRSLVRPRQQAMFLMKQMTNLSYPAISQKFNKKNHSTVIHAMRTMARLSKEDMQTKQDLNHLKGVLRHGNDD